MSGHSLFDLAEQIRACRLCSDRFAATCTGHAPRPVLWLSPAPPILVVGQAPGARVHASGVPFSDRSGDRLRDWMGLGKDQFYDRGLVSILPMAFCFPGYDARGADLPPPPICARTWHDRVTASLGRPGLTLVVGGHAQKRYLGSKMTVTQTVADWRRRAPGQFVLPHPSWRNTGWLARNPWFETDLLPALRQRVADIVTRTPAAPPGQRP